MKCFYHSADFDGKCSAALVKLVFPHVELFPIDYNESFPWDKIQNIEEGIVQEQVFMVDFSLKRPEMERLNNETDLTWIDHHVSAIEEMKDLDIKGKRDTTRAACELVSLYLLGKIFSAVQLLGSYDVWRDKDPNWKSGILPFQMGLRLWQTDPRSDLELWRRLCLEDDVIFIEEIILAGKNILQYQNDQNRIYARVCAFEVKFEGLRGIAINRALSSSQIFDSVWDPEKYDLMIAFSRLKDGKWKYSLYTTKDEVDCSVLAKKYGGGGHVKAAGFNLDYLFESME
jgi:oligoribonuclease NrnB/cAMP/cGMP phosphodiesterase (DHH superfamily)